MEEVCKSIAGPLEYIRPCHATADLVAREMGGLRSILSVSRLPIIGLTPVFTCHPISCPSFDDAS